MGTTYSIISEWTSGSDERESLLNQQPGLVLRWLNEAQLRYAERSEMLRDEWKPEVPVAGNIAVPTDFLYEFADRVKRNAQTSSDYFLRKADFPLANARTWSGLTAYSIWNGKLYVWAPQECNPSVPYVRKPAVITDWKTQDLEIPREYQHRLIDYLDAMYLRRSGDIAGGKALFEDFYRKAREEGQGWRLRYDKVPVTRSNFF